jgi:hypothetical protein
MPVNQEMLKVAAELAANTSAPSTPSFWSKLFPPYEERMRLGQKSMRALMGPKPAKFGPPVKKSAALDLSPYVPGASLGAGAGALIGGVGGALFPGKKRRLMSALRGALAGAGVGGLAGGALSAYRPDMISGVYDRLGKFLSGVKDDPKITALNKQLLAEGVPAKNIKSENELPARSEDAGLPNLSKVEPDYSGVKPVNVEPEPVSTDIQFPIPNQGPRPSVLEQPEFNDSTYARDPNDVDWSRAGSVTPDMLRRFRSEQSGPASVPDFKLVNILRQYIRENPYNRNTGAEGNQPNDGRGGLYPKYFNLPAFEE